LQEDTGAFERVEGAASAVPVYKMKSVAGAVDSKKNVTVNVVSKPGENSEAALKKQKIAA
jgi:hypothetical protein